ncbi:hypothetical protein ANCDUO_23587, partial [Ancylostoma duodenale]
MAELPDLSGRCDFESCNRLGEYCFQVLAFTVTAALVAFFTSCFLADFLPFTCPLCKCCYWLSFSSDHRFIHGCDGSKQYDPSTATPSSSGPLHVFLCSFSGCMGAESIKIVCPHCERNYCLKWPMNPADQKKMDKILIMKLKMNAKATADVPPEERIFLFVEGDDLNGRQAVVVSK